MIQRGVLSLVSQEVSQLSGGEHTTVTRIVSEHGVQLGPSQQLPAELLDLYMIQTTITGSVTPLGHTGIGMSQKKKQRGRDIKHCMLLFWECYKFPAGKNISIITQPSW